jgi:hypothetical protein
MTDSFEVVMELKMYMEIFLVESPCGHVSSSVALKMEVIFSSETFVPFISPCSDTIHNGQWSYRP